MNCGGLLTCLIRTRFGDVTLAKCIDAEEIENLIEDYTETE